MERLSRTPRRVQRGLTLVELLVGTFIALTLTAAALAFALHETRLMGASRDKLEISQTTHAALDLIAEDVAEAGTGIGYDAAGNFAGLMLGTFTVGACTYNPVPNTLTLTEVGAQNVAGSTYDLPITDLGIRYANGHYASIADYDETSSGGQHCQDIDFGDVWFADEELVVLRSEYALDAFTARIVSHAKQGGTTFSACREYECNTTPARCVDFTFAIDPSWSSDPTAATRGYRRGEIHGGYREIVWYIEPATDIGHAIGSLRRAVFGTRIDGVQDLPSTCASRIGSGAEVATYVETFLVQPYTFNELTGVWERWTVAGPINTDRRIRVDMELVVRSESPAPALQPDPRLRLTRPAVCIPAGTCGSNTDYGRRYVYRTSVHVKNSGRVRMKSL